MIMRNATALLAAKMPVLVMGFDLTSLWPLAAIVLVFYFLIIQPQRKRDQARREMLSRLRKNDRVVTTGGIHGEIMSVKDEEVILKVDSAKDVNLKCTRGSISRVLAEEESREAD